MSEKLQHCIDDFMSMVSVPPNKIRVNKDTRLYLIIRGVFVKDTIIHYNGIRIEIDENLDNGVVNLIYNDNIYVTREGLFEKITRYMNYRLY